MAKFEKIQNSGQLVATYAKKVPKGAFLLLGEEEAEKEKCIALFEKHFFDSQKNSRIFHCDSDEFLKGADFVISNDMFVSKKIAIFKKIEAALKKKHNYSIFEEVIESASENCLVICESSSNRAPAALKKLMPKIETAIFWKRFESDLAEYISSEVKKAGKEIDYSAVTLILSLCGRSIAVIDDALKNIIFGTSEKMISIQEVKELIPDNRAISIFECIDAIFNKDKNSLKIVARTLEGGTHELVIISMIFAKLNQIELWHMQRSAGIPINEVYTTISMAPKQRPFFEQVTRRFSANKVKSIFIQLYHTEKLLKSTSPSKNILANPLADLIYTIIH